MDICQFDPDSTGAYAYFQQGMEYSFADDFENSVAAITQAILLDPTNAKYYYRRATVHFIAGQRNEAIADYTEALRLGPDPEDDDVWNFTVAEVYDHRAAAYRYLGDYDASLAEFAELIRLEPNDARHYMDRSVVYKIKGDFENSFADLDTFHHLDPDNQIYFTLLGDLYRRQGDSTAMMATYDEAILKGGTPAIYASRGQLWKERGDFDKAIADFEEAGRRYPEYYEVWFALGETYLANGNPTKALDALNIVMEHRPDFRYYGGFVFRGHAYAALGHTAEAVADYQNALELEPTHSDASLMREYIANHS